MSTNSTQNSRSRYQSGGYTDRYAKRLGWWERVIFTPHREDVEYTIESRYNIRPDLLAYDVYGSPRFTWAILQFNNILDINTEFVTGRIIKLPTPQRMKTELT